MMQAAAATSSTSATNGTDDDTTSSCAQALAFAVAALQQGAPPLPTADTRKNTGTASSSSLLPNKDFDEKAGVRHANSRIEVTTTKVSKDPVPLPSKPIVPLELNTPLLENYHLNKSSENNSKDTSKKTAATTTTDDAAAVRLQRSRERNREHARRTRLRKKAHVVNLQSKCKGLQAEKLALQQQIEDRSIASILLGLSSNNASSSTNDDSTLNCLSLLQRDASTSASTLLPLPKGPAKRRKRGEAAPVGGILVQVMIDGELTEIGLKSHINWKTGMFSDDQGRQKKLTADQLESLRRERNRMHAKMTRDRKKCFIATMEKTIEELEHDIACMRGQLKELAPDVPQLTKHATMQQCLPEVSPMTSPELSAMQSPEDDDDDASAYSQPATEEQPHSKRVCHGFSLDG